MRSSPARDSTSPITQRQAPTLHAQPGIGRGRILLALALVLCLLGAVLAAAAPFDAAGSSAAHVQTLNAAWAVAGAGEQFPANQSAQVVSLPDDWARTRPGYQGSTWYRIKFDLDAKSDPSAASGLLAAYIERACTNLEARLNGQLVYTGGRMEEPVTRNCYHPHVIALPAILLRPEDNWLDIKVVGYPLEQVSARQRAAGLSAVRLGPMWAMRKLAEGQLFWKVTLPQMVAGVLVLTGAVTLMLAWVRRLPYLFYFGLASLGFALTTAKVWLHDLPLPHPVLEALTCWIYAPLATLSVLFILGYAGYGLANPTQARRARWIEVGLWLQCLLLAAAFAIVGPAQIFAVTRVCYHLFAIEGAAAIVYFLLHASKQFDAEFWIMGGLLCSIILSVGLELAYQDVLLPQVSSSLVHFVLPLLFCFIAFRLIQVYAEALETLQTSRIELEQRIRAVTLEVEQDFNQKAQARIEKIAEKERKRIASDLHDDLGAKLLTIIHTSDSERISNLAREALEEMRLSVRGLTGRPVQLADAMADWRSETVSRLGETSIRVDWKSPSEIPPLSLSARTYVQTTRILREAVSNIIKHSGSSHCDIAAIINRSDFQIIIHDNGRGIPMQLDGKLDRGHGMSSMKSRAKQLQGQCLVESGPNLGTIIRLTLPLEIPATNAAIAATMSSLTIESIHHEANPPA